MKEHQRPFSALPFEAFAKDEQRAVVISTADAEREQNQKPEQESEGSAACHDETSSFKNVFVPIALIPAPRGIPLKRSRQRQRDLRHHFRLMDCHVSAGLAEYVRLLAFQASKRSEL